jgi:hypothetical protein
VDRSVRHLGLRRVRALRDVVSGRIDLTEEVAAIRAQRVTER